MTLEQYLKSQEPKLSHASFGELVGVTQATINRYVRGERFPAPDMILKIDTATNGAVKVTDWYSDERSARRGRLRNDRVYLTSLSVVSSRKLAGPQTRRDDWR